MTQWLEPRSGHLRKVCVIYILKNVRRDTWFKKEVDTFELLSTDRLTYLNLAALHVKSICICLSPM